MTITNTMTAANANNPIVNAQLNGVRTDNNTSQKSWVELSFPLSDSVPTIDTRKLISNFLLCLSNSISDISILPLLNSPPNTAPLTDLKTPIIQTNAQKYFMIPTRTTMRCRRQFIVIRFTISAPMTISDMKNRSPQFVKYLRTNRIWLKGIASGGTFRQAIGFIINVNPCIVNCSQLCGELGERTRLGFTCDTDPKERDLLLILCDVQMGIHTCHCLKILRPCDDTTIKEIMSKLITLNLNTSNHIKYSSLSNARCFPIFPTKTFTLQILTAAVIEQNNNIKKTQ